MALSHIHLALNHVPVLGTAIALALLLLAFLRRSDDLRRASLEVFVIVGLLSLPVYLSGVGAQTELSGRPEVTLAVVQAHHDAALQGSAFMLLTAVVAWLALWQTRQVARPGRGTIGAVALMSVFTLVLMGRAANLGGQIRHPEVAGADAVPAAPSGGWLTAETIAELSTGRIWVWPAAETLHFVGMWLLFGVVLLVNLRLLGVMKQASFASLHRLLPWAVLGLVVNVITGMVFVIGAAAQYTGWPFYWKIGLLMVAGFNLLYLTIVDAPWTIGPGDEAPAFAKVFAAAAIVSWLLVMYFGRMLPFLGDAF